MREFWNNALFVFWTLCLLGALLLMGGVVMEYALPFYLAAAALVGMWSLKLFFRSTTTWVWTSMHLPVIGLLAYTALRWATSPIPHEAWQEFLNFSVYTLVYLGVCFSFYRPQHQRMILALLIVMAVGESVYGYWQHFTGADKVLWFARPLQYHGRASGTYICPNHLAGWLEVVALLLLAQLVINRRPSKSLERSVIIKLLEVVALVAVIAGLIATHSRGGWMALCVGAVAFWIWAWRTKLMPPRVADISLLLLLALIATGLLVPGLRHRWADAFSINLDYTFDYNIVSHINTSQEGRMEMTSAAWQMFLDHPLWGVGPGAWRWFHAQHQLESLGSMIPHYAHNDLFQFAAEHGLVGLALLAATLVCFFFQAARFTRPQYPNHQRALALGSILAVCAMLAHSLVDFNMHIPANALLIATLAGLVAGMSDNNTAYRRYVLPPFFKVTLACALLVSSVAIARHGRRLSQAHRYLREGRDAQAARNWEGAILAYQRASGRAPHFAEPHTRIGEVYRLQMAEATAAEAPELGERALAAYNRALERNPHDATPFLCAALVNNSLGKTNDALACFNKALGLDPLNPGFLAEYGRFQEQLGNTNKAIRAYEKAARGHDPEASHRLRVLRKQLQNQNR